MNKKTVRIGLSTISLLMATCVFAADGAMPALDRAMFTGALTEARSMPRLHSLLVSHNGKLVVEEYFNGLSRSRIANVKSVSKSIMSALIGIAIEQGHIEGLDQPISDYYGDRIGNDPTGFKQRITVGNLLSMQAGLETTSFYNFGAWVLSDDWVEFALNQPVEALPGSRMLYSTGNTHLLSGILTMATGQSTLEFARESLAGPMGFHLNTWTQDPNGVYFGGNNMEMTPRQMMAFGEMYLNNGEANGRQVIPTEWVETSLQPKVRSRRDSTRQYGYGWWIRDMAGVPTMYAWGFGGQFILLAEDLDMVVV
ncbi:MAG: serine hydrolase, partial [Woeseiaceae bacterium]|nr:serine hydrolase [Woeseiaceae bacterium]